MTRDTRLVAIALASVAAVISGLSILCSWAIASGASPAWRSAFKVVCHGMVERSLVAFGQPMPICARCFGIYAGLLAGVVLFALMPWVRERAARIILWIAVLPIAIDGVTQAIGLRTSTNALRIATGVAVAIAFAMWALAVVQHRDQDAMTTS